MLKGVLDWLEHRTGIESAIKHFLYEEIPASSGWHQVIGSMAVFAFSCRCSPEFCWRSITRRRPAKLTTACGTSSTELTGGRMIRGLHHWGASMMIVIVVLHMIQVFLYGAYKKPREATWMVGVRSAADHAGFRADRLSAAVGQPRLLGNGGHDADRGDARRCRSLSHATAGRRRRRSAW